jgi:hypothetical protein
MDSKWCGLRTLTEFVIGCSVNDKHDSPDHQRVLVARRGVTLDVKRQNRH